MCRCQNACVGISLPYPSVPACSHCVGPRDQTLVVRLVEGQAPSPAEPSCWSPNKELLKTWHIVLISKLKDIKALSAFAIQLV